MIKKSKRLVMCLSLALSVLISSGETGLRGSACKVPTEVKLLITSFGTIDSQSEVEGWLSDLLKPQHNVAKSPELLKGDMIADPSIAAAAISVNWKEKS